MPVLTTGPLTPDALEELLALAREQRLDETAAVVAGLLEEQVLEQVAPGDEVAVDRVDARR